MKNPWTKRIGAIIFIGVSILGLANCAGGARAERQPGQFIANSYDVVIIGAGGAGLSAAIAAKQAGATVAIFEKMPYPGGNTALAGGGINAAGTAIQEQAGIRDNADLFFSDTMTGGYNRNDPTLVWNLAEKSAASLNWLLSLGADLWELGRTAGTSVDRTHRPRSGGKAGPEIVQVLEKQAETILGIPLITQARATKIIMIEGRAAGIEVAYQNTTRTVLANKGIVLATGGFGANSDLYTSLVPSLRSFATANHRGATGEGIALAENIGAALVDMDQIQINPTYSPGKALIADAVRGIGAILINSRGSRFVDELGTPEAVSHAILAEEGGSAFLFFDDAIRKSLAIIEEYVISGCVIEGATVPDLATAISADPATLAATVTAYNQGVALQRDAEFARADLPRPILIGPYYAIPVIPAVQHTMGGVRINADAQVISTDGSPIPGLYAAGEVTGGIHGGNQLEGNGLADSLTYGRIAGANAAKN